MPNTNSNTGHQALHDLALRRYLRAVVLRNATSDFRVFHQVFIEGQYADLPVEDPPRHRGRRRANIGLTSLFFLRRYPQARVIAIEPDPENFAFPRREQPSRVRKSLHPPSGGPLV